MFAFYSSSGPLVQIAGFDGSPVDFSGLDFIMFKRIAEERAFFRSFL